MADELYNALDSAPHLPQPTTATSETPESPPKIQVHGPTLPPGFHGKTLYEWLGLVTASAETTVTVTDITEAAIQQAFKRQRRKCHPNAVGGGDPVHYERVRQAYAILSTPQYRAQYDTCDFDTATSGIDKAEMARTLQRVGQNLT
mmetsp:Transcript_10873/g.22307  ORF Transcript_10873/g.22307 Transcript_10873/m.22307 type:complete len:146 (+) Transcript_10873:30-467(+)